MTDECMELDALVAVGEAMGWDAIERAQHLATCEECTAQLHTMQLVRASLMVGQPVDDATRLRIMNALGIAAAAERSPNERLLQWEGLGEALAAGLAGLLIATSTPSGIREPGAAVLAFVLGSSMLLAGRWMQRRLRATNGGLAHG